jgi:HIV Tat-specific factor 1
MAAERVPFPQVMEEFDQDDRVSYSKTDSKWILENTDGSEWEWNESASKWMPSLDESLLAEQSKVYEVAGVVDDAPPTNSARRGQKRTSDDANAHEPSKRPKQNHPPKERKNTAVYVTNLPLDVTRKEVIDVFSKYGVIAEEIDSGRERVKLYHDDDGKPKGDGLVVYFRPESVPLAIQMLDDSDFRIGQSSGGRMRVKEADMSYKKQKDNSGENGGEAPKGQDKRKADRDKSMIKKRTEKLNAKLADWSDDEDVSAIAATSSRWDKVVVLKHMFTLKELADDPAALLDIKEDIRDECARLGSVTNVVLFDKEEDGVVTVKFATPEAANACVSVREQQFFSFTILNCLMNKPLADLMVQAMHGRWFGGQSVIAHIATGAEKFSKTKPKKSWEEDEEDGTETKRLDEFGEWLERGDGHEGDGPGGGEQIR